MAFLLVSRKAEGGKAFTRTIIDGSKDFFRSYTRGVARDQWSSYNPEECKLSVAESFTACVNKYITTPDTIRKMGECGYQFLLDNYQVDSTYQKIISHIK